MATSFLTYRHHNQYPVTYLFLEVFASFAQKSDESSASDVLTSTLESLGVPKPYTEEFLTSIALELTAIRDARSKQKPPAPQKDPGRSPGSEMLKWLSALDIESILLFVCEYDYERAYKMYSTIPVLMVDSIVEKRVELEKHRIDSTFESVVYGFGGNMKSSSPGETIDVSNVADSPSAAEQLKKFKFM